jgi:L-fuculose-phosphate aldolase
MNTDSITHGAAKTEDQHRREICTAGRWIHERHFVASTDGNISIRLDSQRILTSPTGISKGLMSPDDMVITDLQGRKLAGRREPSSELAMHLLFYVHRPDINAVCHAHPPIATAHAAAGMPLNKALLSEIVIGLGHIPVAQYGTPGTPELSDALEPLVRDYDAILMANHGVVTCGGDLLTAFFRMETVEHFAQVSLVSELLGKQVLLSSRDVEKLLVARARYGATTAAPITPDCPLTSDSPANGSNRISITREELEALIDEAVRKDRAHR